MKKLITKNKFAPLSLILKKKKEIKNFLNFNFLYITHANVHCSIEKQT